MGLNPNPSELDRGIGVVVGIRVSGCDLWVQMGHIGFLMEESLGCGTLVLRCWRSGSDLVLVVM